MDASTQTDPSTLIPVIQLIQLPTTTLSQDPLENSPPQRSLKRKTQIKQLPYHGDDYEYFMSLPKTKQKAILKEEIKLQDMIINKVPLRFKILTSNMNDKLKAYSMQKLDMLSCMDHSSGEYNKLMTFLNAVSRIPLGNYQKLSYKSSSNIGSFLEQTKNKLDTAVFGHDECKDQIIRLLAQWITNPKSPGLVIGIEGPMGCGKCHARDTPILMYNGDIKMVQDIVEGDLIMGDDSTPRKVTSLGRGVDQLYDVIYVNQWGEHYTVNSEHILCIQERTTGQVSDVFLKDYLTWSEENKERYVGIRAKFPVVFQDYNDGITESDIHEAFENISSTVSIPQHILISNLYNRRYLLELIRSRWCSNTLFIKHPNEQFLKDIIFLARSLGEQCYMIEGELYIPKNIIFGSNEHLDLMKIKIRPSEVEDYYGFTLDGNKRYLMGDFTTTHNTTLVKQGICKSLGLPFGFVPLGGVSDGSYLIGHSYTYEGSRWGRIIDILMACECMNPILFFDELDKVSDTRHGEEIINILIHLTDASQNTDFHDKYFADLPLDLSRCLVVFSYNNGDLINPILKDRMVTIKTNGYNNTDKRAIVKSYMLKEILDKYSFKTNDIIVKDDIIDEIIEKTLEEKGVRNLKRSLEDIISTLNLERLMKSKEFKLPYTISNKDVRRCLKKVKKDINPSLAMIYM